ncbi:MAG: class I SAM-dependent methyltransferase [Nitriliruptoraceae bacterium]
MSTRGSPTPRWSGEHYAAAAEHHREFDDWFLDQYRPDPGDRVIDAGCGSGEFTARLAELVPDGEVVGVEPDHSMLEAARRHEAENLDFREGRLQDLDQVCEPSWADLVISRSVFHWIPIEEYLDCYRAIHHVLRPGGWLHAESGGAGNVQRLEAALDDIAAELGHAPGGVAFPDAGTVLELLEQAGLDVPTSGVTTVAQRRHLERDQLLAMIRTQASRAYGLGSDELELDRFVAAVDRRSDELRRHDGTYDQTFVRLHVLARRPR